MAMGILERPDRAAEVEGKPLLLGTGKLRADERSALPECVIEKPAALGLNFTAACFAKRNLYLPHRDPGGSLEFATEEFRANVVPYPRGCRSRSIRSPARSRASPSLRSATSVPRRVLSHHTSAELFSSGPIRPLRISHHQASTTTCLVSRVAAPNRLG
jgi:hypothetical protein